MDRINSSQETIAPVIKTIRISMPEEAAFRLFTEEITRWWPLPTHSVGGDRAIACVLEGRIGGRFYEVQQDGTQSDWGQVLVWEPPLRVAFTMHPGRTPEFATEVEVSFSRDEAGGTVVTLIHRGWERLGEIGQTQRDNYNGGWDTVLENYAIYVESM